jgi:hypothetical protein
VLLLPHSHFPRCQTQAESVGGRREATAAELNQKASSSGAGMPIRTIELKNTLTREERIKIWFTQLKSRLKKHKREREELRAQGKLQPKRLP